MRVRPATEEDREWITAVLTQFWGGPRIVAGRRLLDATLLPALIAGEREGLATFAVDAERHGAELVTLNALTRQQGIGGALLDALVARLRGEGVARIVVHMTNDNLDALRFYQRRGFRLTAVDPGAIDRARRLKPSIPEIGAYGIPVHDELELILAL
jgi:GNAT superfamily N-acetyltransferase